MKFHIVMCFTEFHKSSKVGAFDLKLSALSAISYFSSILVVASVMAMRRFVLPYDIRGLINFLVIFTVHRCAKR